MAVVSSSDESCLASSVSVPRLALINIPSCGYVCCFIRAIITCVPN